MLARLQSAKSPLQACLARSQATTYPSRGGQERRPLQGHPGARARGGRPGDRHRDQAAPQGLLARQQPCPQGPGAQLLQERDHSAARPQRRWQIDDHALADGAVQADGGHRPHRRPQHQERHGSDTQVC